MLHYLVDLVFVIKIRHLLFLTESLYNSYIHLLIQIRFTVLFSMNKTVKPFKTSK